MNSRNNARSHRNKENHSEEDFTLFGSKDSPFKLLFQESNEETNYNAEHNTEITVPTNLSYSENSEIKQTSAVKQSATSEDVEQEPELEPQGLLIWALEHNKFERFSSVLKVPGVDPKFKYGKPHYKTCIELACKFEWGEKFVKALLQRDVKPTVHEIHPGPIHHAAKYGNPGALEALLQNKKTKVNVVDSSGRTALHHAVRYSMKGRDAEYERCIELLLERPDLALNIPNTSGYTAVHTAANTNKKAVELILKYRKDDVDLDSYKAGGRTARECIHSKYPELGPLLPKYQIENQTHDRHNKLLLALQQRQQETFDDILCQVDEDVEACVDPNYYYATCLAFACREKDCAEYAKAMLGAGADPNFVNPTTKQTPLQVAVETRNIHVLRVLVKHRRTKINAVHDELKGLIAELDQHIDNEEIMEDDEEAKKDKDAIDELKSILSDRSKHSEIPISQLGQALFQHLYDRKYEDFKSKFTEDCKDTDDGYYTLLQYATRYRLEDIVQLLLKSGANPNATTELEKRTPFLIACKKNYHKIIKLFFSSATNNELDVNVTDAKGNSPLHYVSNTEYLDFVVDLIRSGADLQHKNIFNKSPLPANSAEKFLDKSLQTNGNSPEKEEYEIIFDYSFLVAHNEKGTQSNLPKERQQLLTTRDHESGGVNVQFPEKLKPEMSLLFYMIQSDEHRKLMQHPIIKSFLDMKWQCVKQYFYINICIYFLFAGLLNAYILLRIGDNATNGSESGITSNDTKTSQSNLKSTGLNFVLVLILIILLYFTVRELLQLALSPKVYVTNWENILDFSIIFFAGYIIFSSEWYESLVVITIILSWTELILLTGRLPKLSKNIEMLKKVSLNYFWFLLSYFFLLIAFAFSFYSLLHKNATNGSTKYNVTEDQYFFMNPHMSVMKTFVMMMGEFGTESIQTEMANSPTCFCLFALFLVIIAIVLLNLLTGLAVSDTQEIKLHAEQLSVVSHIRLIYEIESTLLQWYAFVEKCSKYTILCPIINSQNSKIKNITLFPDTSYNKRIHVSPNKVPNILTNSNVQNISYEMPLAIIGEAARIISKRSEPDINNMKENFGQIQEALKQNESKLSKIQNKMQENQHLLENYQQKFVAFERKLEHDKIQSKNKGSQKMKHNATTSHKMENTPCERWSHTEATNQEQKQCSFR